MSEHNRMCEADCVKESFAKQLQAADKLAEAAKQMSWRVNQMECPFGEIDNLDEALAAYEKVRGR